MSWIINLIKKIFGVKAEQSGLEVDILVPPMTEETVNFNKMNKKELEKYGRTLGVELDRRLSRSRLIELLTAVKVKPEKHRHIKSKKKRIRKG